MISAIAHLDRVTAAGILARAALALEDESNPAAKPVLPEEIAIRARVMNDVRKRCGIDSSDHTDEARERLGDALDEEGDALLGPVNIAEELERLSEKGELPSDLYKVYIIPNIVQFQGKKFPREERLIEETVRAPDLESHYGPPNNPRDPYLISIFARTIHDQYPARSFIMLVAAERRELTMTVHQAWRLYPDEVDLNGASSPLDMLRRFAEVFGTDITVGDQHGKFILSGDIPNNAIIKIESKPQPGQKERKLRTFTMTFFRQQKPNATGQRAALLLAVDLDNYREKIESHGW